LRFPLQSKTKNEKNRSKKSAIYQTIIKVFPVFPLSLYLFPSFLSFFQWLCLYRHVICIVYYLVPFPVSRFPWLLLRHGFFSSPCPSAYTLLLALSWITTVYHVVLCLCHLSLFLFLSGVLVVVDPTEAIDAVLVIVLEYGPANLLGH